MDVNECPKCQRKLIGAGICPTGHYRAPGVTSKKPSASGPSPSTYSRPRPASYSPFAQPSARDTVSSLPVPPTPPSTTRSYSTPAPAPYQSPSAYPIPSPPPSVKQNNFGRVQIRGKLAEVGAERQETASLAAQNAMRNAAFGMFTAIPRAIGLMLGIIFAPLRMLILPSLMGGGRRQLGPDQLQVPVTPFVLQGDDGVEYDCILRGETRGGFLKLGEPVEVSGRIDGTRVVRVDQLRSLRTNAVTRGWVDPRARMSKFRVFVGLVFLIFFLMFLFSVLFSFGRH